MHHCIFCCPNILVKIILLCVEWLPHYNDQNVATVLAHLVLPASPQIYYKPTCIIGAYTCGQSLSDLI